MLDTFCYTENEHHFHSRQEVFMPLFKPSHVTDLKNVIELKARGSGPLGKATKDVGNFSNVPLAGFSGVAPAIQQRIYNTFDYLEPLVVKQTYAVFNEYTAEFKALAVEESKLDEVEEAKFNAAKEAMTAVITDVYTGLRIAMRDEIRKATEEDLKKYNEIKKDPARKQEAEALHAQISEKIDRVARCAEYVVEECRQGRKNLDEVVPSFHAIYERQLAYKPPESKVETYAEKIQKQQIEKMHALSNAILALSGHDPEVNDFLKEQKKEVLKKISEQSENDLPEIRQMQLAKMAEALNRVNSALDKMHQMLACQNHPALSGFDAGGKVKNIMAYGTDIDMLEAKVDSSFGNMQKHLSDAQVEFKVLAASFYNHSEIKMVIEQSNKPPVAVDQRAANLAANFDRMSQDYVSNPQQQPALGQLMGLMQGTLAALNNFDCKGDPKLIAMTVMVEKALQKACANYASGVPPEKCAAQLATELRSVKNETKEAILRTFGKGNKTVQDFSDRLLGVLKDHYPDYKDLPKVKVSSDQTKAILQVHKNIKAEQAPAMKAGVESRSPFRMK